MKSKLNYYKTFFLITLFGLSAVFVNNTQGYDYQNPLEVDSVSVWIQNALAVVQGWVGLIAVMMIVIAGIIYMFSGANSNWITTAKNMAMWAIVGFTIAIAAPSLLKEIMTVFDTPLNPSEVIDEATPLAQILTNDLSFLLTIIGIIALISFVVAGFQYLTSAGDKNKADNAKKIIFYSIIAILVAGSGAIIVRQVFAILVN
ncbi:MAG: pilin [Patescibacteria group bacterium]|jgi:hypothetical protein|nr:pilin [Patescibacteria group bacterium]